MNEKDTARQSELILIVETINALLGSKEWRTLRERVFDGETAKVERQLLSEAKSTEVSLQKLYTLQGELLGLKRYDLANYAEKCKNEIEGLKNKIKLNE